MAVSNDEVATLSNETYDWNENTRKFSASYNTVGDPTGRTDYGLHQLGDMFQLKKFPVISITTLELNKGSIDGTDELSGESIDETIFFRYINAVHYIGPGSWFIGAGRFRR